MRFIQVTPTFGDATAGYEVVLQKDYTVLELFNEILKRNEWGRIKIEKGGSAEYSRGKIIKPLDIEDHNKKILSVKGHGGWSMMDYVITTK